MAKAAATPESTAAEPAKTGFHFDVDLPIPAVSRAGAKANGDLDAKLTAMPVGASFLEPVAVSDAITDVGEKAKAWGENARKAANRLSGATRRFTKKNPEHVFAIRVVNNDTLGVGVRVWRIGKEAQA